MTIKISKSTFRELEQLGFTKLLQDHFNEVANPKYQFVIDYQKYYFMDDNNMLSVYKVIENNILVGYSIFLITNPLHYYHLDFAYEDIYYLHPSARKGWNGIKFFKFILNDLKNVQNVDRIIIGTKLKKDNSRLFERLGGKEFERLWEF